MGLDGEPRARLTRERVVRAAVALADTGGVEALTMRKLGQALGVEAMSLYNHVANKDDLLDGMVDLVFAEIGLPAGGDWKRAMRQRALSARSALARHPWAIGLLESRSRPGPETLRHHDAVIRSLREAGFSFQLTAHAYSIIDSYMYGFALQQASLPLTASDDVADLATTILDQFPIDAFPHFAEFTVQHVLQPGYDYAGEFEFGLDLILDGLDRLLENEISPPGLNAGSRPVLKGEGELPEEAGDAIEERSGEPANEREQQPLRQSAED
jgi:AcrR family transcriptional regulator